MRAEVSGLPRRSSWCGARRTGSAGGRPRRTGAARGGRAGGDAAGCRGRRTPRSPRCPRARRSGLSLVGTGPGRVRARWCPGGSARDGFAVRLRAVTKDPRGSPWRGGAGIGAVEAGSDLGATRVRSAGRPVGECCGHLVGGGRLCGLDRCGGRLVGHVCFPFALLAPAHGRDRDRCGGTDDATRQGYPQPPAGWEHPGHYQNGHLPHKPENHDLSLRNRLSGLSVISAQKPVTLRSLSLMPSRSSVDVQSRVPAAWRAVFTAAGEAVGWVAL